MLKTKTLIWMQTKYFIVIVLLSLFMLNVSAWSWPNNYKNNYNITVLNYSYNAVYGTNSFTGFGNSGYVLVNLTGLGDPNLIQINGYSNSLINLGRIPFYYVNKYGNTTILLIRNTTNNCRTGATGVVHCSPWQLATVFYNPVNPLLVQVTNSTLQNPACVSILCYTSYNGVNFLVLGNSSVYLNLNITRPSSNVSTAHFNFTPKTQSNGLGLPVSIVVLSNQSLNTRNFNINVTRSPINKFAVYSKSNRYWFQSYGVFGGIVTSPSLKSHNANLVFNNIGTDDYEGYFSWYATNNNIITEQEGSNIGNGCLLCNIFNASSTNGIGFYINNFFNQQPGFDLRLDTNTPTTFVIMPAFTVNYITTSNTNLNAFSNNCGLNKTWDNGYYCDFTLRTLVSSINWSTSFTTYAYPGANLGKANTIIEPPANVGYLLLSLPHSKLLGLDCGNVQMGINDPTNGINDTIPFFIKNCTSGSTGKANYILSNTTVNGRTYSWFYVYFSSPQFNDYSNATTRRNFIMYQVPTNSQLTIPPSNTDYYIFLNQPLNLLSDVEVHETIPTSYAIFTNLNGKYNLTNCAFSGIVCVNTKVRDDLGYQPTMFFRYGGMALFTKNLAAIGDGLPIKGISNTVASISESQSYLGNVLVVTSFPVTAIVEHIYTTSYNLNYSLQQKGQIAFNNTGTPLLKINGTTTILFNTLNPVLITVAPNVNIPKWWFAAFAVILILLAAGILASHQMGDFPYMLMLIAIWLSGVWDLGLIVVAIAMSVIFILYEYTKHRRHSEVTVSS